MSDDDDYMSDKFLVETEKCTPPSLVFKKSEQREIELLKRKVAAEEKMREKNKSAKAIEQERREEGLASAIASSNKGFKMLMKMGYKPGQGIGKTESGRTEPIPVDLKTNRLGLGKSEKRKSTKSINPTAKLETLKTEDFRNRISTKKSEQLTVGDLLKSQKVCEVLDVKENLSEPKETWFWPEVKKENKSDEEVEAEEDDEEPEETVLLTSEKLEIITKYLRDKYFYCIWCGATYGNDEDLKDNCPGSTRDSH
ncbi:G patch domain-containing protein 11 [Fopius arisanus]|uniref:G patch domain-containing protein 11 n=1 Tax=Fopius arisanus TaxID=64838 RepID=A0A9R1TC90_9HYME|nr:PREDICTED: G patch domain-containing protein 11 [Fopius arisanus]